MSRCETCGYHHDKATAGAMDQVCAELATAQARLAEVERNWRQAIIDRDRIEDRLNVGLENTAQERDALRARYEAMRGAWTIRDEADKHFQHCDNCQGDHYPCRKMAKLEKSWKAKAALAAQEPQV